VERSARGVKIEHSESKTANYENRVLHEIATQVHSRSFILQSITGRQGVAYRHIILAGGLISDVCEEAATQIAKNCSRRQPHSHLRPPTRGTPANVRMHLIFLETRVIGLHFRRR